MDIQDMRDRVLRGAINVSRHAQSEMDHDDLTLEDLVGCISSGKIVDEDFDTSRGVEYLVEGRTWMKRVVRVKVSLDDEDRLYFITAYNRRTR